MDKQAQSQLVEFLLDKVPSLRAGITSNGENTPETKLFSVWKNPNNSIGTHTYNKPDTLSQTDIEEMSKQGLIRSYGDKLEITSKGGNVIKVMILGDDRSALAGDDSDIDFRTAQRAIKAAATKRSKKVEDDWWSRFQA